MTRPDAPDPAAVAEVLADLAELDDEGFADALADCIMRPDPVEQAAFRSPQAAERSLIAARYLIDNVNSTIRKNDGESDGSWRHRAEHFRNRVGMERRMLQAIVDGLRAQQGRLPNAPNPRARAREVLARRHPQEYLSILRELEEAERQRKREAKAAAKAARRAEQGR